MKSRALFILLLLGIAGFSLLSACNPLPVTPSLVSTGTNAPLSNSTLTPLIPKATSTSTQTPLPPTPTKTPSITPVSTSTLASKGPYLMFDSSTNKGTGPFIITNADGNGKKVIELPEGGFQYRFQNALSPDGKWLVFFTGSIDEPYDLALNLLSLASGEIRFITNVFSNEYPENLDVVADTLYAGAEFPLNWSTLQWNIDDCLIFSPSWSPDGQSLAFSGQMDGPSFDIYIYDVVTGKITRKKNDLRVACSSFWSPKGEWLLYETVLPGMNYFERTLFATKPDDSMFSDLTPLESGTWWQKKGWLSENDYLMTVQGDGGDPHILYTLNIQTGQITTIWPDIYFAYAYDPENQLFVLVGAPSELQPQNGYFMLEKSYLISSTGTQQMIEDNLPWRLIFRGGEITRFVGFNENVGVLGIDIKGHMTEISQWHNTSGIVSPDFKWLSVFNNAGFQLFDKNDNLIVENTELPVSDILWRPDSQGFFIVSDEFLYYFDLIEQEPTLVDLCNGISDCWINSSYLTWLP